MTLLELGILIGEPLRNMGLDCRGLMMINFPSVNVIVSNGLLVDCGRGKTFPEAAESYAKKLSGRRIAVNAMMDKRIELQLPEHLTSGVKLVKQERTMTMELTSPGTLYTEAPMLVMKGHSYQECLQCFRDIQNQALEVAANSVENRHLLNRNPDRDVIAAVVRALKHRPQVDGKAEAMQGILNAMDALEAIVGVPGIATLGRCYRQALQNILDAGE